MKFNKWLMLIAATIMIVTASAELIQPVRWGTGNMMYNYFWDMQGNTGVQNGSVSNIMNISTKDSAPHIYFTFGATSLTGSNQSVKIGGETFFAINGSNHSMSVSSPVFYFNISVSNNASWSCRQFVAEVNRNSTVLNATACAGNQTRIFVSSANQSWDAHKMAVTTNITGAAYNDSRTTMNFNVSYFDVLGNFTGEDLIFRSRNGTAAGDMRERMRIKANASIGAGLTFTDMAVPISNNTPIGAIDGTIWLNITDPVHPMLYVYWGGLPYHVNGTGVS